jgi:hypothetical protein
MYKSEFLNAVSIGFDPIEWEPIEEKSSTPKASRGSERKNSRSTGQLSG